MKISRKGAKSAKRHGSDYVSVAFALGIEAVSFARTRTRKDIAESPTAKPERPDNWQLTDFNKNPLTKKC